MLDVFCVSHGGSEVPKSLGTVGGCINQRDPESLKGKSVAVSHKKVITPPANSLGRELQSAMASGEKNYTCDGLSTGRMRRKGWVTSGRVGRITSFSSAALTQGVFEMKSNTTVIHTNRPDFILILFILQSCYSIFFPRKMGKRFSYSDWSILFQLSNDYNGSLLAFKLLIN
jgi:hypothetical protein